MIPLALFWAICWKLSHFKGQSAENYLSLYFYRFLRDYTPKIFCYNFTSQINNLVSINKTSTDNRYFNLPENPNYNNINSSSNFAHYITGLIEGDGSIVVPKTKRSEKGKLNYPSIQITFNLKDVPLALIIQKCLGHGSLSKKKGVSAYVLTINNYTGLLLLVSLLNGNMRTPKINSLWLLINWLNSRFTNLNLIKSPLNTDSIMGTPWLAGFIDAGGHFSVRTTTKNYIKIECKFELSQRQIDHNGYDNLYFLEVIAEFLLTTVKNIRLNNPKPEYRLRTTSLQGNINLESYLNKYPLFSSKYLDYQDWLEVLSLFKLGVHLKPLGVEKIINIKSGMNDRRTIFIWDHLQKFYNLEK